MAARIVIVTGLSGAGKTQALRYLEDMGYFCVDNLPAALIPKFAELCAQASQGIHTMALVIDVRSGAFFQSLSSVLNQLEQSGLKPEILYLEASDEVLVRRFKASRRRHPLSTHGEVLPNIHEEKTLLAEIKGLANRLIDTSNLKPLELKNKLEELFGSETTHTQLLISVISFGFKYGIPLDSDLVMDVRFLPNPYYDPVMRPFTGNDSLVRDFVLNSDLASVFIEKFFALIDFLLPCYIGEGKTSLTIAIGCTGGVHRSVALVNKIGELLGDREYRVAVTHRDVNWAG